MSPELSPFRQARLHLACAALHCGRAVAAVWEWVRIPIVAGAIVLVLLLLLCSCHALRPQRGGTQTATLGGAAAPTVVTTLAPENPQTPSTTTVEKHTMREYLAPRIEGSEAGNQAQPATHTARLQNPTRHVTGAEAAGVVQAVLRPASPPSILRETVTERATTELGTAQKDTAREVGARLANMRGVMWVGVALLIGGPLLGWKMGWPVNGMIAGAVGLLLIILATVIPGNEAWFGLGGLVVVPLVAFVYYRARHDASEPLSVAPATAGARGSPQEPARSG